MRPVIQAWADDHRFDVAGLVGLAHDAFGLQLAQAVVEVGARRRVLREAVRRVGTNACGRVGTHQDESTDARTDGGVEHAMRPLYVHAIQIADSRRVVGAGTVKHRIDPFAQSVRQQVIPQVRVRNFDIAEFDERSRIRTRHREDAGAFGRQVNRARTESPSQCLDESRAQPPGRSCHQC